METYKKNIPPDFDHKVYIKMNNDLLLDLNDEIGAEMHFGTFGYQENRKYKFENIPSDFDPELYLKINDDIKGGIFEAKFHYEFHGRFENRKYKYPSYPIDSKMKTFLKKYETTYEKLIRDPKMEFRFICFVGLSYIKNIQLPEILLNNDLEAVLIEYRPFPHLEFLIRNAILKLGKKWSFTVVCGRLNHEFIISMCSKISPNIKIILTPFDNLFPSQYSTFIASHDFWNRLHGKKILIYQEDAIIFKKNIGDFLHWDYIGAPWSSDSNNNFNNVGNGGLSLRTKDVMKKIIDKIPITKTKINDSTIQYMKNTNSVTIPEDVYFSKNMEDLSIGKIADRYSALQFSTESIGNEKSFGGHNFWIGNSNWKKMIYANNIITFKPNYDFSFLEHRGGWKSVIECMIKNNFYSHESDFDFFDMLENQFLWNTNIVCNNKWSGIIHCTPNTPEYFNIIDIENLFYNSNFILSLQNCFLLFTLSSYITKYLQEKLTSLKINIPIYTLKLPVVQKDIPFFNIDSFLSNNNKLLIQLGQQLRKVSSIYRVDSGIYEKLWLTGTKNFEKMMEILFNELNYLKIDPNSLDTSVKMYYTQTFEEYDELLTKNIIFIDFFDAAANNAIVECIIRHTPIIVNKVGGIEEYLGEDYPLYFNELDEIPSLLDDKKILDAYNYLVKMDKDDLTLNYFYSELNNAIYKYL